MRISPKVSGQVLSLHVDDNLSVNTGAVLLEIDPVDYQAKVDQAIAAVAATQSAAESEQVKRTGVIRAEAAVGEAKAAEHASETDAKRRASDYRRYAAMGTDGISEQQLETAKDAADSADDQREAAAKKLDAASAELNVAKTSVGTAEAQVAAANAQLRFAQLQLQYTKVTAPEPGNVTNKNVEQGAIRGDRSAAHMAIVPEDKWVIANFKEVQLERIHAGQSVIVGVELISRRKPARRVQSTCSPAPDRGSNCRLPTGERDRELGQGRAAPASQDRI